MEDQPRVDAIDRPQTVVATVSMPQVTITVTHHAWSTWAIVAIENEQMAREVRTTSPADEHRPALVAITAAAFSLDALSLSCEGPFATPRPDKLVPFRERIRLLFNPIGMKGDVRWRVVAETMCRGARGRGASDWRERIRGLFDERDRAVHFEEVGRQPEWHEPLDSFAAVEHGYWSVERTAIAVDLVLEVLTAWRDSPSQAAGDWSERYGDLVTSIIERRPTATRS